MYQDTFGRPCDQNGYLIDPRNGQYVRGTNGQPVHTSQMPPAPPNTLAPPRAPGPPGQWGGGGATGLVPQPHYGQEPAPPPPEASAALTTPKMADLAGNQQGVPEWYRMAWFPTAPFFSTRPDVGYQPRYYSGEVLNAAAGAETIVTIQFDLPCRVIALNGAALSTAAGNALPIGVGPRDCFLFRMEYTTGDRLHINARIASLYLGIAERPGEIGGVGYTIDGGSVTIGITPLIANLRINFALHCVEMRGPRNYVTSR